MAYEVGKEEFIPTDVRSKNVYGGQPDFGLGRGKLFTLGPFTPVRSASNMDSPAFFSTRVRNNTFGAATSSSDIPLERIDMNTPGLGNLITQIAQQVGQRITDQLR